MRILRDCAPAGQAYTWARNIPLSGYTQPEPYPGNLHVSSNHRLRCYQVNWSECLFFLCDGNNLKNWRGSTQTEIYFNKCGTNIYFFTLQRFGPSPSPNFKLEIFVVNIRIEHWSPSNADLRIYFINLRYPWGG